MAPTLDVTYAVEAKLSLEEFHAILQDSTLGERRPADDLPRLQRILENSNLIITARMEGQIIGLARSITDYGFSCYVSDLAVSTTMQGRGVGKELMKRTKEFVGPQVSVLLTSAPNAVGFYEGIGMPRLTRDSFIYQREG